MRLARSAFSAALVSLTLVLALVPALGSARPPRAYAAAADVMVEKINKARARHGLRPLRTSASLSGTSQAFAAELMRQDVLRHRLRPSTSSAYGRAGEVLSLHLGRRLRPGAAVAKWMRSPSHRAVLLTRSMKELGAGYAQGRFGRSPAVIWVAQVGSR